MPCKSAVSILLVLFYVQTWGTLEAHEVIGPHRLVRSANAVALMYARAQNPEAETVMQEYSVNLMSKLIEMAMAAGKMTCSGETAMEGVTEYITQAKETVGIMESYKDFLKSLLD